MDLSSPKRKVILSQPFSSTNLIGRLAHCGNCSEIKSAANDTVIAGFLIVFTLGMLYSLYKIFIINFFCLVFIIEFFISHI